MAAKLKKRFYIFLMFLLLGSVWAMAACAEWHVFGKKDDLANGNVRTVYEDSSGNLWFGTEGGVSRYDGMS
jgi:ligand-binding sensor domain-containing protein